jgi:hypothetical protein
MQTHTSYPFVGFGTFERMLEQLEPGIDLVYLVAIEEPVGGGNAHGVGRLDLVVEAAAVLPDRVLYCRIPLGAASTLNGALMVEPEQFERIRERGKAAVPILGDVLAERGFKTAPAAVAFPRELKLMSGWAECLEWDKDANVLRRAEPILPAAAGGPDGEARA